jgi:hypothetical protein
MGEDEGVRKELSQSWDGKWLILHLFYNALNPVSKSMLDTAAGGTFMGKGVEEGTKLLDDMQNNHSQLHVEMSSRKVNSITEIENEELIARVNELLGIVKGKETHVNAITNANVEDVDFIARNLYMPAWMSQNYGSNFQKNYSNPAGNPNPNNNNNNGVGSSNLDALEISLKSFMNSQNEQNKVLMKITENHDTLIAKLSNQAVSMKSDMQDIQERTKTVEAQLGKIAESQTLILAVCRKARA